MRSASVDAFAEEFEKVAWGATMATSGVLGALGGAAGGYLTANPDEGSTGLLRSMGKGALTGGALGAAAGGGLALAGKHLGGLAAEGSKAIGDFGRRQVHSVTGYVPKGISEENRVAYLKGIGIGRGPQEALTDALKNQQKVRETTGILPQSWREARAARGVRSAQAAHEANETFLRNGATSIPGVAEAFWNKKTRGETLGAVGQDLLHGGGTMGSLMLGAGALDLVHGAVGAPHPNEQGMGRGEILGRSVGNAAGWLLPSPLPIVGQSIAGSALGAVSGYAGRGVDRLLGNRPVAANPTVAPPGGMV